MSQVDETDSRFDFVFFLLGAKASVICSLQYLKIGRLLTS